MNFIFTPFKYRNYRFLISSVTLWVCAIWIANLSFGLIAKELHGNSPFYVGMVGFGFNAPVLIFTLFGGVFADRFNRHKLMLIITGSFLIPCLIMALMLSFGWMNYWIMIIMVFLFGSALSISNPVMNALVPSCIDDQQYIGKGVTLFNAITRTLQFLGNAIAGVLYALIGSCLIFWTNAILIILSLIILKKIHIKSTKSRIKKMHVLHDLKDGLRMMFCYFPFAMIILLAGFSGFFAWPYIFQLPIVNAYNLHGTPITLGLLLAIGGFGGTIGAFLLAFRQQTFYLTRYMLGAIITISLSLIALSSCKNVFSASFAIFFLDMGMSCLFVVTSVFIQQIVFDEKRGRAMSILVLFNFGLIPIGSLLFFGVLGQKFGAMRMFQNAGIIGFIISAIFIINLPKFRRISKPKFIMAKILKEEDNIKKV